MMVKTSFTFFTGNKTCYDIIKEIVGSTYENSIAEKITYGENSIEISSTLRTENDVIDIAKTIDSALKEKNEGSLDFVITGTQESLSGGGAVEFVINRKNERTTIKEGVPQNADGDYDESFELDNYDDYDEFIEELEEYLEDENPKKLYSKKRFNEDREKGFNVYLKYGYDGKNSEITSFDPFDDSVKFGDEIDIYKYMKSNVIYEFSDEDEDDEEFDEDDE